MLLKEHAMSGLLRWSLALCVVGLIACGGEETTRSSEDDDGALLDAGADGSTDTDGEDASGERRRHRRIVASDRRRSRGYAGADVPDSTCAENADCSGGELCRDGVCVTACFEPTDCADGEECIDNLCVSTAPECSENRDCRGGEICRDGDCVPIGGPECDEGEAECDGETPVAVSASDGAWQDFACVR